MRIEKAKEKTTQLSIPEPCIFSDGWLTCFKLRHGIKLYSNEKQTKVDSVIDNKCENIL